MSHIPNSAMKHAGPSHAHGSDVQGTDTSGAPARRSRRADAGGEGIGVGTWVAIGGTLLAGAAAAIAVPLLRARRQPIPSRRGRKATVRKGKARKA